MESHSEKKRLSDFESGIIPTSLPVSSYSPERLARRNRIKVLVQVFAVLALLIELVWLQNTGAFDRYGEVSEKNTKPNVTHIGDVHWWATEHTDVFDGQIIVPMDYKKGSNKTMTLGLRKLKASKEKRGTIFLNPGGPGVPGDQWSVAGMRGLALSRVGPYYDIVGFSPRGTASASPVVDCFPSREEARLFGANTVMQNGISLHPSIGSLAARQDLIRAYTELLALQEVRGAMCAKNMDLDALKYMGTTYVAKDIDFMATVLEGEDAEINYFGASYGSILGAYLVNMFPNRIGRAGIDGIVDAARWEDTPSAEWYPPWLIAADGALNLFLSECVQAGPDGCELASEGETAEDLLAKIDEFLKQLYYRPLPVISNSVPGVLTSGGVVTVMEMALEVPMQWPIFAKHLSHAMHGNPIELYTLVTHVGPGAAASGVRHAVTCADNTPYSRSDKSSWPTAEHLADVAIGALGTYSPRLALSSLVSEPDGGCQFWPTNKVEDGDEVERFQGPWNHTLKNPVLIYSSTLDPITPMTSAIMLHENLKNSSGLLLQNSAGHTSTMTPSLCTAYHSLEYFNNGVLPPSNITCELDRTPFGTSKRDKQERSAKEEKIIQATIDIYYWAMGEIFV